MRAVLVFVVLLVPRAVLAQPPERVLLADVVREALETHPSIAAALARYDAARERPVQERSLPDPMISAGYSANGRPWPGAGLGTDPTSNVGVMVTQDLPIPGKRRLRSAMAQREADAEFQMIEAAKLEVVARVKQAYYRLAYTHAAIEVLTRNRRILETLLKVSETRYTVGKAAQQDVIKAQTQLSILDLQLERVRQEQATGEGELNALRGRPPGTTVGVPEELQLTPFDASLDALVDSARDSAPMLRRDTMLIDRSQLAVDAARKDYQPDVAISGGYYNQGAMPPMYEFRVDIKLPLQRARRAAAVAEQTSSLGAARRSYEAARLDLQSRIQEDYQMASTSVRLARLYRDTVLPQARLALESSMASYETGAVDFLSVVTNFGAVLEHEMAYFDELASYHTAVSRLEAMTGAALVH